MSQHSKILIIGKNGQVGWELCRTVAPIGELVCIDFPDIDLTNESMLRQIVQKIAPNVIVNAAAYTAVDKAETETELSMKINAIAPGILAEEAKKTGALMVHYSTDYVFDGTKKEPYLEDDAPNPINAYGRSKLEGDQAVQRIGVNYLIFRLCWVYGARGQNFMLTMMRLAREREELRVVADQVGSPTWSRMIAETTALALQRVLTSPNPSAFNGLYNLCASGHASWHQFADAIVASMPSENKKCNTIKAITTVEYPTPARRPYRSILGCDKLKKTFGLRLPDWKISLDQVRHSM